METFIRTYKCSDSNQVTHECRMCGFQSKWLRKLFFNHVKPKHMARSKIQKGKKRKSKNIKPSKESKIKRTYICEQLDCTSTFADRRSRKRHMKSVHGEILSHDCSHCGKCFRDKLDLERHLNSIHNSIINYSCPLCTFASKYKRSLVRHEQTKHGGSRTNKDGKLVCDYCERTFTKQYVMTVHMNMHRAIQIGFKCVFCDRDKMENHVCEFSCFECDRNFNMKAHLKEHMKVHSKIDNVSKYLNRIDNHLDLRDQILDSKY